MSDPVLKRVTGLRVRYGETDQMRYAYHAWAAFWFDVARTELLRGTGRAYRALEDEGWILPVLSLHVNYHLAAHYDDELELRAGFRPTARGKGASSIQFDIAYEVWRDTDLCYSGWTRHCFLREQGGKRKAVRLPEWMLDLLEASTS